MSGPGARQQAAGTVGGRPRIYCTSTRVPYSSTYEQQLGYGTVRDCFRTHGRTDGRTDATLITPEQTKFVMVRAGKRALS